MTSILDDSKKITEKLANVNLAKKIFKGQKYEGRLHGIIKRLDLLSKNAVFLVLVSTLLSPYFRDQNGYLFYNQEFCPESAGSLPVLYLSYI